MVLVVALPLSNNVGRLIGYYMTLASATPFVALLAMISSNVAGYTKKTTVAAIYLIGYCAGNIIGMISSRSAFLKLQQLTNIKFRPPSLPSQGRTTLCSCRDHHHCLLGRLPVHSRVYLVVVPYTEREEGPYPCKPRIRTNGEPRVSQ